MEPAELLGIFRANIVIVRGVLQASGGGQTDYVRLVDRPTDGGSYRVFGESRAVPVKALMAAAPDDQGAFAASICNYDVDTIHYQTLRNDPRFMFTPTMNGCTFGIGSPVDGALIVSHANKRLDDQEDRSALIVQQGAQQGQMTRDGLGSGSMFGPEQYQFGPRRMVNMTFFGVFDGGWSFYHQQYEKTAMNVYRLVTFQKVAQNRLEAF